MAFLCKACKLLPDHLDLFQLFVPPTFQLGGRQSVPGIYDIVLFEGSFGLILQLFKFAG